ncbi:MAG: phenylalanine--tRNA ligase beta subunit-related protein [Candidatus Thalassarchaeaceae archaeon]|jgi:DNA/RNA-binding domain of Phe-tRNA-synthetase-like protein|nr:phenylalanine--tRNA ligase beta subunit-related protein [Candidatus Thalassarchaeaceae archaeon]
MFHITREGDLPKVEPRILLIERGEGGWPVLDEEDLEQRLEVIRNSVSLEELRKEPDVAAYRQFYWRLGIDPTKRRPSAEALVRRIVAGKPFPRINPIVDRYNLISAENRVSLGAFSVDYLADKELVLRMANQDELFLGIGFPEAKPCTGQELVLAVAEEIIALYPYRDSHNSRIRGNDSSVLFVLCVVPGVEESRIEMAANALVSEFTG